MSRVEISRALPQQLVAQRERRGLTQSQLGARAGIAAGAISHFETGQRLPSLESLVRLAEALECSLDQLLGRQTPEQAAQHMALIDPIFARASRSDAQTLDAVRRVTAALLDQKMKPGGDDA